MDAQEIPAPPQEVTGSIEAPSDAKSQIAELMGKLGETLLGRNERHMPPSALRFGADSHGIVVLKTPIDVRHGTPDGVERDMIGHEWLVITPDGPKVIHAMFNSSGGKTYDAMGEIFDARDKRNSPDTDRLADTKYGKTGISENGRVVTLVDGSDEDMRQGYAPRILTITPHRVDINTWDGGHSATLQDASMEKAALIIKKNFSEKPVEVQQEVTPEEKLADIQANIGDLNTFLGVSS